MSDPVDNLIRGINAMAYNRRTIVAGLVDEVDSASGREQTVDFRVGIADLAAGEPEDLGIAPTVPMLSIGGGGFFFLLPSSAGDESLGLVVDRASGPWRANKTPGQADRVNGKRSKELADLAATPFQFTAPTGAPDTWDHLVIGGPAGVGIEVDTDGTVTITGQAIAPATPTTIVMSPGGDITLSVGSGNSVNAGGNLQLVLAQALQNFLAGAFASAPVGTQDGGLVLKNWLAGKMAGVAPAAPPSLVTAAGTETTKGQ